MNIERKGVAIRTPLAIFGITAAVLALGTGVGLNRGVGVAPLWAWLASINVATFVLYSYDKNAARRGALRVPETILHVSAFLGGAPAALAAQQIMRHKTAKRGFQFVFWVILAMQIVLIAAYARLWNQE